ncbi:hypothetical protein FDP41_005625 [Naegleria fowleri]|uniref:F-box domain-containing protein n=1 Tax=Naegleria fowleri TaxID=5763 RepID=A0A6A5BMV0_NAEFO|nr:uncharacterized protein FDP41_005625 [Naegleria fowleri]KAF0975631.1 hypothetical protein FDP41_005625 [Naegleria fowleri]CAG4717242.1 unnamed protein product [Naegleria fowleri]
MVFPDLPIELQFQLLWYCDEKSLLNVALTCRHFYHYILGDEDESEVSAYRSTIWKNRILFLFNSFIDEVNKKAPLPSASSEAPLVKLSAFKESDLNTYIDQFLYIRRDNHNKVKYNLLLNQLKQIQFRNDHDLSASKAVISGRRVENVSVQTWCGFISTNYPIVRCMKELPSNFYCGFRGFELVVERYHICGNGWNIVYGVGTDYTDFNKDKSIAQFVNDNLGIGYILECSSFKLFGDYKDFQTSGKVQVGDRFAVLMDYDKYRVHFFKNGLHIASVESPSDTYGVISDAIVYYPIVSMCIQKSVTLYPLLQSEYLLDPDIPVLKVYDHIDQHVRLIKKNTQK